MRALTPSQGPTPSLLHLIANGVVVQINTIPRYAAGTDILNPPFLAVQKQKGRSSEKLRPSPNRIVESIYEGTQPPVHRRIARRTRTDSLVASIGFMRLSLRHKDLIAKTICA
jgi:hypothetical protein